MDKRKVRDLLRLLGTVLFSWLYIPHYIAFLGIGGGVKES